MADPNSTTGLKFHKKFGPGGPLFSWNIGPLDRIFRDQNSPDKIMLHQPGHNENLMPTVSITMLWSSSGQECKSMWVKRYWRILLWRSWMKTAKLPNLLLRSPNFLAIQYITLSDLYAVYTAIPLNWLDVQILFVSLVIAGRHNPHFETTGHSAWENMTKSIETTFVTCANHLGHIHHQWSLSDTVLRKWTSSSVMCNTHTQTWSY